MTLTGPLVLPCLAEEKFYVTMSILNVPAYYKFVVAQIVETAFDRGQNTAAKGENCGFKQVNIFLDSVFKCFVLRALNKALFCGKLTVYLI